MAHDNPAAIRELFDAFNDGDLDRASSLAADDFELVDVPAGQTFEGPEGLREWLGTFRTAFPDSRAEVVEVLSDGDRVATEHIGRGTHEGELAIPAGTIPATGRTIELTFGEFYDFRDGKLIGMRAYYDTTTLMRQLGLMPAAGSSGEKAMTTVMGLGVKAWRAVSR
jgi:steroid delta-isomerase-like uncharacterized protein